jgi:hypothetical protein
MASFTGVGDSVELTLVDRGETVAIALSGTYNMTIRFQKKVGVGAWQTVYEYTTANATVADIYVTEQPNETVRLIVMVDTSGTCTATLTDSAFEDFDTHDIRKPSGEPLVTFDQGGMRVHTGFQVEREPLVVAGDMTLTEKEHAGRLLIFNAATARTITLPTPTGKGAKYRFFVNVTVSGGSHVIQVPSAAEVIQGALSVTTDAAGVTIPTTSTSDTITLSGSTTGGVRGSYIEIEDVSTSAFRVSGALVSTGAEATPFSADVS